MKNRLPREILSRKKIGFQIPLGSWLRNNLNTFLQEMLLSNRFKERGYFNYSIIEKLIDEHNSGKVNNAEKLWRLITFETWHRIFIDRDSDK